MLMYLNEIESAENQAILRAADFVSTLNLTTGAGVQLDGQLKPAAHRPLPLPAHECKTVEIVVDSEGDEPKAREGTRKAKGGGMIDIERQEENAAGIAKQKAQGGLQNG